MGLRVLGLGAGVQSSTLLLMACEGLEHLDAAVFADTGRELTATYRHLDWLEGRAGQAGIPIYRVSRGNLRDDALAGKPEAWMPLHLRGGGHRAQARRQCTSNYKIALIKRQVRSLGATADEPAALCKGITIDEIGRVKDSDVLYIRHAYPLIDRRMTRGDCRLWLEAHGYPIPPKSACVECPYHDTAGWRAVRAEPEAWAEAVAFDRAMRKARTGGLRSEEVEAFLHFSGRPLEEVDLSTASERGQLDLFGDECEGVCGV
jgi:hypothetical protein